MTGGTARTPTAGVPQSDARQTPIDPGVRIILASASPRRAQLLKQLVREFEVVEPRVVELSSVPGPVEDLATTNALAKAQAVARTHPDALVIGADTIVVLGERVLGKPTDVDQAVNMLLELRGKTHRVITGVALVMGDLGLVNTFAEASSVTFKPFDIHQAQLYVRLVNTLDKAGAYAIQEHPELIIAGYSGSWSNIVGLPLERLRTELVWFCDRMRHGR